MELTGDAPKATKATKIEDQAISKFVILSLHFDKAIPRHLIKAGNAVIYILKNKAHSTLNKVHG